MVLFTSTTKLLSWIPESQSIITMIIQQYSNKYTLNTYCYCSNVCRCYDVFLYQLNKMQWTNLSSCLRFLCRR